MKMLTGETGIDMSVLCAGLDARAAAIVMRTVRNIVNTGRTIGKLAPEVQTRHFT